MQIIQIKTLIRILRLDSMLKNNKELDFMHLKETGQLLKYEAYAPNNEVFSIQSVVPCALVFKWLKQ